MAADALAHCIAKATGVTLLTTKHTWVFHHTKRVLTPCIFAVLRNHIFMFPQNQSIHKEL